MNLSDNIFRYDIVNKECVCKNNFKYNPFPLSKYRNTLTFVPYFFMVLNLRLIEDWLSG